jgi:hypothetical protein
MRLSRTFQNEIPILFIFSAGSRLVATLMVPGMLFVGAFAQSAPPSLG